MNISLSGKASWEPQRRDISRPKVRVAVIGPDEPIDRPSHTGVFGSHCDEGRITRILDPDRIWAIFAQRSIARSPEVQ
jgi:sarcosine oxidase